MEPRSGEADAYPADLDGDGDIDLLHVVSGDVNEPMIVWYANSDGGGTFNVRRDIAVEGEQGSAGKADVADVDNDDDLDVVTFLHTYDGAAQDTIVWYENANGDGSSWSQQTVALETNRIRDVSAADIDGDGDVDIVSSQDDGSISWYENTNGRGVFGEKRVVGVPAQAVQSILTADLDTDQDIDVIGVSNGDTAITWYENLDTKGAFSEGQLIGVDAVGGQSAHAADLDGDGDLDLLSAEDSRMVWYENLMIQPLYGDANRDQGFDQLDIVQVLQTAKYLTGEPATWSEGDWNGDGVFDQGDIVAALATGNYMQGAYVDAVVAVQTGG
jgi:hypothetical protein